MDPRLELKSLAKALNFWLVIQGLLELFTNFYLDHHF